MTTIPELPPFEPGYRLIDGAELNLMIEAIELLAAGGGGGGGSGGFGTGRIVTAAGSINLFAADGIVEVAQTVPARINIYLPTSPVIWQPYTIVDGAGVFAFYNAIVIPASGTIVGLSQFIMANNWQSNTFYWNGTNWRILV